MSVFTYEAQIDKQNDTKQSEEMQIEFKKSQTVAACSLPS